jgi:hypothetical protein
MALPQIVNTLTAKRDEIEAHIKVLRDQLRSAESNLSAVTAVLSLYELSPATQTRLPAYVPVNRLFTYGEMFTLAKEAIAQAGTPLTTQELALAIIRTKRWDELDMMLRKAVAYRPIQSLGRSAVQGRIRDAGRRQGVRVWGL